MTEPTDPTEPTEPTNPTDPANPPNAAEPNSPPTAAEPTAAEPTTPTDPAAAGFAPVQPPSSRRGLPGWAWALIGGGALVLIAMIVIAVIVVNSVLGAIADDQAAPAVTATPSASESTPPTEPTEVPTEAPAAGSAPADWEEGIFSLDDQVDLAGTFPVWGYPIQDGWEIVMFDQGGLNQTENAELGCLFTSSQNRQPADDLNATDDLTDTLATVDVLEQQLLANGTGAKLVGDLGSTDFGVNSAAAAERIEFVTTRVDYMNPEAGVSYTNEIAARAMPLADSFMYIVVSCPTALVDAGDSPFEELRDGLAVIVTGPPS